MRRWLIAVLLIALPGCANKPAERPPLVAATVRAGDVLEVRADGARRMDAAELVAPNGQVIAAESIESGAVSEPEGLRPDIGVGVEGGSSSGVNPGISVGVPLGKLFQRPAPPPPVQSVALFRLPPEARQRLDWPQWQIRLRFVRPGAEPTYRVLLVPPDSSLSR
jgi:hypothetical protein